MGNSTEDKKEKKFDIRMMRPTAVTDKKTQLTYTLQQGESFDINGKKLYFTKPNNIAVFVSIAHKERELAKELFDNFIKQKLKQKSPIEFKDDENTKLYDYFERIQTAIVTIYTAVEALSNVAIPRDFKLEKINNKKVKEIWNKESIERWLTTSEKLADIVPDILKIESPKKLQIWTYFKRLEEIRNDIIHQKTTTEDPTKVDTLFLRKLLSKDIFLVIDSGFAINQYYCEKDKTHSFFPFGFGEIVVKPLEVEDIHEFFALVEESPNSSDDNEPQPDQNIS
ncbi:MAG: hypothetical protein JWQ09_2633 [Segetibacter sp.]|nr:hypothetical protein [Segetibacter sp.]